MPTQLSFSFACPGREDHPTLPAEPDATAPGDLDRYDHIIIGFSGGKDSIAAVLTLLEAGVSRQRIELWHHEIDGREGSQLMDWPVTPAYCRAFAATFAVPIFFCWKVGGFERELLRDNAVTAPTTFENQHHQLVTVGGTSGKPGTRRRFPQISADLKVRWCSAYLKIDVAARAITNQARFTGKRTLFITGERAEESPGRARYATFERHRTDKRDSPRLRRHVDHWRPVHHLSEADVWALLKRWRINPHPAYRLGWGRVSCAACIFGSNHQWASLRAIDPARFHQVAAYEQAFGCTIRRNGTIVEAAGTGRPYAALNPEDAAAALACTFNEPIILPDSEPWTLPAGAFGESCGPT